MCGRTACPIDPVTLRRACTYKSNSGNETKLQKPNWKDPPGNRQFVPSYNAAPGAHLPVLLSGDYFDNEYSERVLQPMQWGLVPQWYRGNPKEFNLNMNNCRSESMLEKRSFKVPLEKGQRCVAVAYGYFEWKTEKNGKKQPYFIYFPQEIFQNEIKNECTDEEANWTGPRLLTMAAIFDVCKLNGEEEPLYSFSVITVNSSPNLSWLHHRMPAILDGEEAIQNWLDYKNVPLKKAVELIHPIQELQWHPVTQNVNNSRYRSDDCIIPIIIDQKTSKLSQSGNLMMSWLDQKKVKSEIKTEEELKSEASISKPKKTFMDAWLTNKKTEDITAKVETSNEPCNKKVKLEK